MTGLIVLLTIVAVFLSDNFTHIWNVILLVGLVATLTASITVEIIIKIKKKK